MVVFQVGAFNRLEGLLAHLQPSELGMHQNFHIFDAFIWNQFALDVMS